MGSQLDVQRLGLEWSRVALHEILPIIQIAEFTGVAGLSFLVAFANVIAVATVRRFILETQVRVRRPHYDLTLTMAAIVGLCGFGIRASDADPRIRALQVAAVQANIPREEKFSREYQAKIFAAIRPIDPRCARRPAAAAFVRLAGELNARARVCSTKRTIAS